MHTNRCFHRWHWHLCTVQMFCTDHTTTNRRKYQKWNKYKYIWNTFITYRSPFQSDKLFGQIEMTLVPSSLLETSWPFYKSWTRLHFDVLGLWFWSTCSSILTATTPGRLATFFFTNLDAHSIIIQPHQLNDRCDMHHHFGELLGCILQLCHSSEDLYSIDLSCTNNEPPTYWLEKQAL